MASGMPDGRTISKEGCEKVRRRADEAEDIGDGQIKLEDRL